MGKLRESTALRLLEESNINTGNPSAEAIPVSSNGHTLINKQPPTVKPAPESPNQHELHSQDSTLRDPASIAQSQNGDRLSLV